MVMISLVLATKRKEGRYSLSGRFVCRTIRIVLCPKCKTSQCDEPQSVYCDYGAVLILTNYSDQTGFVRRARPHWELAFRRHPPVVTAGNCGERRNVSPAPSFINKFRSNAHQSVHVLAATPTGGKLHMTSLGWDDTVVISCIGGTVTRMGRVPKTRRLCGNHTSIFRISSFAQ